VSRVDKLTSLKLLKPSGPVQASSWIVLPLPLSEVNYKKVNIYCKINISAEVRTDGRTLRMTGCISDLENRYVFVDLHL
jgi:hypothetical protein